MAAVAEFVAVVVVAVLSGSAVVADVPVAVVIVLVAVAALLYVLPHTLHMLSQGSLKSTTLRGAS